MLGYIRTAPPVPIIPKDDVDTGAVAAARLLDNAADLLAEHGWTHGKMHRDGKYCAIGALRHEARIPWGVPGFYSRRYRRAVQALAKAIKPNVPAGENFPTIITWNDTLGTQRYVIRTMRSAAQKLRASHE